MAKCEEYPEDLPISPQNECYEEDNAAKARTLASYLPQGALGYASAANASQDSINLNVSSGRASRGACRRASRGR